MKVAILAFFACVAVAAALVKRQAAGLAYELPDGAELYLGAIKSTFSCEGRIYGYYGDVDNACRIFHICSPQLDNDERITGVARYSFACGNTTVFDQENLACVHEGDAPDCGATTGLYDEINRLFGDVNALARG